MDTVENVPPKSKVKEEPAPGEPEVPSFITKIRIGSIVYDVEVLNSVRTPGGCELDGQVDHYERRIRVRKMRNEDSMLQAFWHEAFHAACLQSNLNINEGQIEVVTHAMLGMLKDYPHMAAKFYPPE